MLVSAIIKQALRGIGALDANREPSAGQAQDALDALNGLQRSMFGAEIGPSLDALTMTANTTGVYGALYQVAITSATALTFPANPQPGWRIGFTDVKSNLGTHTLILQPNGRLISTAYGVYGLSRNIEEDNASQIYFFREDAGWTLEEDWTLTVEPYFPVRLHTGLADLLAVVLAPQYDSAPPAHLVANAERARQVIVGHYNPRMAA